MLTYLTHTLNPIGPSSLKPSNVGLKAIWNVAHPSSQLIPYRVLYPFKSWFELFPFHTLRNRCTIWTGWIGPPSKLNCSLCYLYYQLVAPSIYSLFNMKVSLPSPRVAFFSSANWTWRFRLWEQQCLHFGFSFWAAFWNFTPMTIYRR